MQRQNYCGSCQAYSGKFSGPRETDELLKWAKKLVDNVCVAVYTHAT